MEKHILLIDDDQDELEIFTEALSALPEPFTCRQAQDCDVAIELVHNFIPDFIFIDFNLPKKNGLECLQELKKLKHLSFTKFIIYSNYIDENIYKKASSLGAFACMKKPYKTSTLTQRLKEILIDK